MVLCKICNGNFHDSSDSVVLCGHHSGPAHLGCCIERCSWDKQPCGNSAGVYDKI